MSDLICTKKKKKKRKERKKQRKKERKKEKKIQWTEYHSYKTKLDIDFNFFTVKRTVKDSV